MNGTQFSRTVSRAAVTLALALPAAAFAQSKPAKSTKQPAKSTTSAPATTAAAPAAAPATTAALPSGREVVDRYIKAIGGREALMKHSSRHESATLDVPAAGVKAQIESYSARPNKSLEKTNIPGMGEAVEGFDGTTAWSISPVQGPRVMSGKQLEQRQYRSVFDAALHEGESIKSLETVEQTDFEGKKAYKVKITRPNGDESLEYFDVDSGLLVGMVMTQDTEMGQITTTGVMSDYKEFDGIKMPTKVVLRSSAGPEISVTINEVHHDVVDPSVFELPAQIKALTGK